MNITAVNRSAATIPRAAASRSATGQHQEVWPLVNAGRKNIFGRQTRRWRALPRSDGDHSEALIRSTFVGSPGSTVYARSSPIRSINEPNLKGSAHERRIVEAARFVRRTMPWAALSFASTRKGSDLHDRGAAMEQSCLDSCHRHCQRCVGINTIDMTEMKIWILNANRKI